MSNIHDVLSGFSLSWSGAGLPSEQDLALMIDDSREKLRKAKKKLKRAKKKGKGGKKLKRKIKRLKKGNEQLKFLLQTAKQEPVRGRWDRTIEKSTPELIKLATVIVDRKLPPPKEK